MFLLLFTLKDDHCDVRVLLRLGQLLLDLAHELDVNVDVFVRCELTLHGRNREHLLSLCLLHTEIEADRVLALILEIEGELLGLADSHRTEVELSHDRLVERNIEGFSVELDALLFLLNVVTFDIFNFKLDCFQELLLFDRVERNFDCFRLAGFETSRCASKQFLKRLLLACHRVGALDFESLGILLTTHGITILTSPSLLLRGSLLGGDLGNRELLGKLTNASQFPVDGDGASVRQHEFLLRLLSDESPLELDDLLVDFDNGLGTKALHLQDRRVGVVLNQTDDLVLVELSLVWERKYLQVQSLINLQLALGRLDDEGRFLSRATFLGRKGRLKGE